MKVLLLIIVCSLILMVCIIIVAMILDAFNIFIDVPSKYPKLKFSQFKKFYAINSDRWELQDTYIACQLNSGRWEHFSFNLIDFYFKYKPFLKYLEKAKEKEKETKIYLNMIAAVKQDIANFEERNAKYVDSKIDEIWRNTK